MSRTKLSDFLDDVLSRVTADLEMEDVLALGQTCRCLHTSTKLKHLWLGRLGRDQGLVERCKPVAELSSTQLERLARHVHTVKKHIGSKESPQTYARLDRASSVTWVHLLGGRWLIVASSDTSISELTLWSLSSLRENTAEAKPVATAYLGGAVADGLVDVSGDRVIIALEIRSTEEYADILSLSMKDGAVAFIRLSRLPGVSRIRALSGYRLASALYNDFSIPCVIDWKTKQVFRLREMPDTAGGCIAMAVDGNMVAIVTPKRLEVYARNHGNSAQPVELAPYRQLCAFALPMPFLDATVTFDHTPTRSRSSGSNGADPLCVIRLCLTPEGWLHVYDVAVLADGEGVLHTTWSCPPQKNLKPKNDKTRPHFGQHPGTLTWLEGPRNPPWRYVKFATAAVPIANLFEPNAPATEESPVVPVYTFSSPDAPALHYMGVHDYDEDLGIFVLGSACGELCVYDLTGRYSPALASCLQDVPFAEPPTDDIDWLPTEPVQSIAAAPFPFSALAPGMWAELSEEMYAAIEARCTAMRPDDVPEDWTTDGWSLAYPYAEWQEYIPVVGTNRAWEMERIKHFLGSPTPLLYHPEDELTIFTAGGLLFLYSEPSTSIWVVRHGMSASDAARAYNEDRDDSWRDATVTDEPLVCAESKWYFIMWQWENALGRNRWQELKKRGGEVSRVWLSDTVFVSENSLGELPLGDLQQESPET